MLNFAQNLHHPALFLKIKQWITTPPTCQNIQKWVLLDGAILGKKLTNRLIKTLRPGDTYNVFAETGFSSYGLFAPHLVRLRPESGEQTLQVILECTDGLPAIAILDATADVKVICNRLFWLANACTRDGLELYCRFADTRITGNLIELLGVIQRSTLMKCIKQWQILDRSGSLCTVLEHTDNTTVISTSSNDAMEKNERLIFTDEQYLSMMKSAEADEIFQMLCEGGSDLVPDSRRGHFHARLSRIVQAARDHRLGKSSDVYQFSVIALATSDEFYADPILIPSWEEFKAGTNCFSSIVESWSDDTWNKLAKVNHTSPAFATTVRGAK